jgi:hypothetical protein
VGTDRVATSRRVVVTSPEPRIIGQRQQIVTERRIVTSDPEAVLGRPLALGAPGYDAEGPSVTTIRRTVTTRPVW